MDAYDPDIAPPSDAWLESDEGERVELVSSYHRRQRIELPNARIHSVIHVIVENQLALKEVVVMKTLSRLQDEGLSRHDALHAIGSVLAEDLYAIIQNANGNPTEAYQHYLNQLADLTAEQWRTS